MPCTDKNPLTREGTSLLNRILVALSVNYSKVDERDTADIILFARRYASMLNYYNENNLLQGDWQDLMRMDISVTLATIARIDTRQQTEYKKSLFKKIKLSANDAIAQREFKFLFDVVFSIVKLVDEQFRLLGDDFEYKNIFRDIIKNKLQVSLANLEQCFNDFKTALLLDYTTTELDSNAPIETQSDPGFSRGALTPDWQAAVADITITVPGPLTTKEKIVYIINHNIFVAQIDDLLNGISSLVSRADGLFLKTLTDFPQHSPHYALFIAFVKLFLHEQAALNAYTKKHLDFYYKDVLQLVNKLPEADSAHLLFELQKPVMEHRLLKNTLFKGGKDIFNGKEISYALTDDVVLNKALVSKLYSTQLLHGSKDFLKASSVANSDDGRGSKLSSADKSWFTFGDVKKIGNAKVGFAIVSNILFLNEGSRKITVAAIFANPVPGLSSYNLNCFTAQFTSKKKWIDATNPTVTANPGNTQLTFTINLSPDDPALVQYDEKVHAENLEIALPVLKIYLNQDVAGAVPYTLLCDKAITRLSVSVDVSGVKDLVLSNDGGTIDASKPFKPFGDFPSSGAGFYIGSKEVFQKKLTQLELNTDWKTSMPVLNTVVKYLRQNNWALDHFNMTPGFYADIITFSGGNIFKPAGIDFDKNEKLTFNTREGFLQLVLNETQYSLASHLQNISAALSNGGTNMKLTSTSPVTYSINVSAAPAPKEVVLNSFSLDYQATTEIQLTTVPPDDNHLLLHLGPFGFAQVSDALLDTSSDAEAVTSVSLLRNIRNEGELFVGIENAEPKQVVNILFQVAEGSSNPLRNMEVLGWYYLTTNNNWKIIKEEYLIDNTNNFTQSGIVTMTLPSDISNTSSLLGKGLHWIKVVAHPYTDAVCKMILIQAQAAKVQLVQDESSQIEFRQLLPASTVSKLVVSDGAIKKIEQPFDSFNGRLRETDEHFYVRVSERLRHKQRAITIWDYEHIVLEKFQKIFKVKCLNHSGFYGENGTEVFCENYPGHVTVITVPNLNKASNVNPLRPYTPVGMLKNIEDYLKKIISPFVVLHVKSPQFEEIQLDFKVKFLENLSESFYVQLLNMEIEKFLCPWAFDNTMEITFGGKIYKSALLNFVEERPYVDYVTCFRMNHIINRESTGVNVIPDVDVVSPSTSRSILVSYFDEDTNTRHIIQPTDTCNCS